MSGEFGYEVFVLNPESEELAFCYVYEVQEVSSGQSTDKQIEGASQRPGTEFLSCQHTLFVLCVLFSGGPYS